MRSTSRPSCLAVLILLLAIVQAREARGDVVLVSQPTVVNPDQVGLGFYSSSHPRPTRNFKRGDDFVLADDARLTRVRWWGLSEGRVFDDLRNFDQYTLEIFEGAPASGGPLPGTLVWSQALAAASVTITPTGRIARMNGAAEHLYEVAVPDLMLEGNRAYVLAISARSVNVLGDAWQWQDGEFFGGHGASYSYASRAWSSFEDTDSAFELIGTAVPGPGPAVIGMAMGVVISFRRGRRR